MLQTLTACVMHIEGNRQMERQEPLLNRTDETVKEDDMNFMHQLKWQ